MDPGLRSLDVVLVQTAPTDQEARAKPQNGSAQRGIKVTEAASDGHNARCGNLRLGPAAPDPRERLGAGRG
jgi:hypothetical protein